MIAVEPKPEYAGFNKHVRIPGAEFLLINPRPNSNQFSKNAYWSRAKGELNAAYGNICAYTCIYLIDGGTVDHFLPKSEWPGLAYEWSNFRVARKRANECKGHSVEVMDPFAISNGWFIIRFPDSQVYPHPNLSAIQRDRVAKTITKLRLNSEDTFVQERCDMALAYGRGHVDLDFLQRRYPFLAAEIVRQGLEDRIMMYFPGG